MSFSVRFISFTVQYSWFFVLSSFFGSYLSSSLGSSYSWSIFPFGWSYHSYSFSPLSVLKLHFLHIPITPLSGQNNKTISLPHQDLPFTLSLHPMWKLLECFDFPTLNHCLLLIQFWLLQPVGFLVLLFYFKNPYCFLNIFVTNFIIHFNVELNLKCQ